MKYLFRMMVCVLFVGIMAGCSVISKEEEKKEELEFEIVEEEDIPEEMKNKIGEQKEKTFQITYGDQEYLYIGQGYGEKETSGYSIVVDECYETEHAVYIHNTLIGPGAEEEISSSPACPYVVVRIKWSEKQVIFKGI